MNSKQIFARLQNMRNSAGELLYERLTLADQLLSDQTWVLDPTGGGGNESIAISRLEEECFADICGAMTISQMLEVLHHFKDITVWKKNKFNLKKMWEEYKAKTKPKTKEKPLPDVKSVEGSAGLDMLGTQEGEIDRLRKENRELKEQVRKLTARNAKLERMIKKVMSDVKEVAAV